MSAALPWIHALGWTLVHFLWQGLVIGAGYAAARALFERAEQQPAFINAIAAASFGRVVPAPGGVLIEDEAGETLGAVGISGDVSDKDEACAAAGIAAAGLAGRTGAKG